MRVLLLDDDPQRHKALASVLATLGFEVDHVYTYQDAIVRLTSRPYHFVMLDYDLNYCDAISIDLSGNVLTGADVAKMMLSLFHDRQKPQVVIHSRNEDGAREIEQILGSSFETIRTPFSGEYA